MNEKPFLPLRTDPFPDLGGEHRKCSTLRISDWFRGVSPDSSEVFRRDVKCSRRKF